ncbi:type III-A CRISPR-associated RAMP protein Csm4 [Fervidobacterium sp. 2310opik-2]|uniref:type III-A CRISPR-associated RAMP protein Csm4 n=1 Tax=Fervidobacterium sp. 2310opik-2 TaxID=1755815 RepID=UPI0013E0C10B|nr:type III-A CRISPR-associated RAMP protein Csm4 [Fervidobacterium sp. 2310opik-2]KAF2961054.1 hypothetical protein AS161_03505 [Fervidobacterium sp. 2310opik-2]
MKFLISLNFKTGFRTAPIAESDSTDEVISSDTLHGAMVYWAYRLFPEKAKDFALNLKVSNMFFKQDNEYLIPKPYIIDTMDFDNPKPIKKSKYVKLSFLKEIIKKGKVENSDVVGFVKSESILTKQLVTRNALDRITNSSLMYSMEVVRINSNYTPVILVDLTKEFETELVTILKVLGDSGIGADNTYGFGIFIPEFQKVPPEFENETGNYYITLGYYVPNEDEYGKLNEGFYKLKRKAGVKKDKMVRKYEINFVDAGSVFTFKPQGRGVIEGSDFFIQTTPICLVL